MRGNKTIEYHQLGYNYSLHIMSILFNYGVVTCLLGLPENGMIFIKEAYDASVNQSHSDSALIKDAWEKNERNGGGGWHMLTMREQLIYMPPEDKVKNMVNLYGFI